MIKIIKERTPETTVEYIIEYIYKDDRYSGFYFPACQDGTPDLEAMSPEMRANYDSCQTNTRLDGPEFKVNKYMYMNPAVGRCTCGTEVILDSDYAGAVRCECGRWYNIFGQELLDPKYWEEDYDD